MVTDDDVVRELRTAYTEWTTSAGPPPDLLVQVRQARRRSYNLRAAGALGATAVVIVAGAVAIPSLGGLSTGGEQLVTAAGSAETPAAAPTVALGGYEVTAEGFVPISDSLAKTHPFQPDMSAGQLASIDSYSVLLARKDQAPRTYPDRPRSDDPSVTGFSFGVQRGETDTLSLLRYGGVSGESTKQVTIGGQGVVLHVSPRSGQGYDLRWSPQPGVLLHLTSNGIPVKQLLEIANSVHPTRE